MMERIGEFLDPFDKDLFAIRVDIRVYNYIKHLFIDDAPITEKRQKDVQMIVGVLYRHDHYLFADYHKRSSQTVKDCLCHILLARDHSTNETPDPKFIWQSFVWWFG